MKRVLVFLCFLFSLYSSDKIAILTIPKSGSHLIGKAVFLISNTPLTMAEEFSINGKTVYFGHLWPEVDFIRTSPDWKKIIMIRDPRDLIVSMKHWIVCNGWGDDLISVPQLEMFRRLSSDYQIAYLILCPTASLGIPYFAKIIPQWMSDPDSVVFRFEDLVGEHGGGRREKQLESIDRLAKVLGYELSEEEISRVADNLFGDTYSFREGHIGSWKNEFSEITKSIFKGKMGKALIDMGYEEDMNW